MYLFGKKNQNIWNVLFCPKIGLRNILPIAKVIKSGKFTYNYHRIMIFVYKLIKKWGKYCALTFWLRWNLLQDSKLMVTESMKLSCYKRESVTLKKLKKKFFRAKKFERKDGRQRMVNSIQWAVNNHQTDSFL